MLLNIHSAWYWCLALGLAAAPATRAAAPPVAAGHPTTASAARPSAPPLAARQAAQPYREEAVSFTNPDAKLQLAGTLTVPPGAGPFPAVLLLSDAGHHDQEGSAGPLPTLADYLTRHGLVVLRCDERGTGRSAGHALPTAAERVTDVRAALNYLRARSEVNLDRLGLVGHGEGADIALLVATYPVPPAFVVGLAASGLTGSETLLRQHTATLASLGVDPTQAAASTKRQQAMLEVVRNIPSNEQAQAILVNMLQQGEGLEEGAAQLRAAEMVSPYSRDLLARNPADYLPRVACPVLLLTGTADLSTPADAHLPALTKALRSSKAVTTRRVAGANHLLQAAPGQWPLVNGTPHPATTPELPVAVQEWIAAHQR